MGSALALASTAFSAGSSIISGATSMHATNSPTIQPVDYSSLWKGDNTYYTPEIFTPTVSNPMPNLASFYAGQSLAMDNTQTEVLSDQAQGNLAMNEAGLAAQQKVNDVNQYRGNTAMAYNGSGVLLQGSPLLVLEQARQMGVQEVQAIQNQGLAQAQLQYAKAGIAQNQGRAQLLGQDVQLDNTLGTYATEQARQNIQQAATFGSQNINAITQMHSTYLSNLAAIASDRFNPQSYTPVFGNGAQHLGGALDNLIGTGLNALSNQFGANGNAGSSNATSDYVTDYSSPLFE